MTENKRFTRDYNGDEQLLTHFLNNGKPMTKEEVLNQLNELHEENQIKLEIVDAFIRGLEDEKGIDSENVEFQCKMNFALKVLNKLKQDMLDPTEFKRLKELEE